jgi:thiamine-monophosphate kinase
MASVEALTAHCLFCDPGRHDQGHQVVLRSDHWYVFAGLGAIAEGYLIITPYRCSPDDGQSRSIASVARHHLDELRFLREIVSCYYRDRYGVPGLSFEHGRAGACLIDASDTRHCFHPHLCCYPVDLPLWEHTPGIGVEPIDGLYELATRVGSAPYLYLEHCRVDRDVPAHMASREQWTARVVRLGDERELESQYLRRRLATALGRDELWDWRRHPTPGAVDRLVADFSAWLAGVPGLVHVPDPVGARIDFVRSVTRRTTMGYNAIAASYRSVWRRHLQHDAVARFVRRLPPAGTDGAPRVLDLACGPGTYLKALHHLGLRCVGTDISAAIIAEAADELAAELNAADPPVLVRADTTALPFAAGTFDGVWFSAAMVHLPRITVVDTLARLRELLVDGGVLYLSAQLGHGLTVRHEGRVFVYYDEDEVRELITAAGFTVVEQWGGSTNRGTVGDVRLKVWRHFLLTPASVAATGATPAAGAARTLADLGERGLVAHIRARLPDPSGRVVLAAGDDAAAIAAPAGSVLVATVDPCPRPVVSLLTGPDPWVDGWYSMLINLSDLAAMGARPVGALLAVEAPPAYRLTDLDLFYDGVLEAADAYEFPVIGGNVKDAERFSCVGVGLGHVSPERMLRRDTARAGEVVLVLGTMGLFWAAVLQALEALPVAAADAPRLGLAMRRPVPRVAEGVLLAERAWSRCAMDSSDGVTACLFAIAASSGVDVHLDLSDVAVDPLVAALADAAGIDVRKLLLAWGDWQLVCTVAPDRVDAVRAAMAGLGCPVHEVGWVSAGTGEVWLHEPDGTAPLNHVASERFTARSYFTHGIAAYAEILRAEPLTRPPGAGPAGPAGLASSLLDPGGADSAGSAGLASSLLDPGGGR